MMQRLVQLALDLFDPVAAPPAQGTARPPAPQKNDKKSPSPHVGKGFIAPTNGAIDPRRQLAPGPALLGPAEFRHPQANRELLLGDALVAYALTRARRRSIGFTVGVDGLSVRAPAWVTLGAVDAALREKSDWIVRKLVEARERQQRLEGGRIVWADGATVPYRGAPLQVVLDPGHRFRGPGGALVAPDEAAAGDLVPMQLHIALPHSASAAQIRDAVQAWLMRDARQHFTARLDHFAPLLDVRWNRLRLSSAHTRWGSAKADGSIRLNWRLLHYPPAVIDYVVVHELAHLRVMDHSPRFWDTVASVVPDYRALRNHLRDHPAPLWD